MMKRELQNMGIKEKRELLNMGTVDLINPVEDSDAGDIHNIIIHIRERSLNLN